MESNRQISKYLKNMDTQNIELLESNYSEINKKKNNKINNNYSNINFFDDLGKNISDAGKNIKGTVQDINKNVKGTAQDVIKNVKGTTKDIGKNISDRNQKIVQSTKGLTAKELFIKFNKETQKYNPAAFIPRGAALAMIRLNFLGFARKMYPAFLSEQELKDKNFDLENAARVKTLFDTKITQAWNELGGDASSLKKAIITGHDKPIFKTKKVKASQRAESSFYGYNECDNLPNTPFNEFLNNFDFSTIKFIKPVDKSGEVYSGACEATCISALIAAGGGVLTASINAIAKKGGAKDNPYQSGTQESNSVNNDLYNATQTGSLSYPPLTTTDEEEIRRIKLAALEDAKTKGLDSNTYVRESEAIEKEFDESKKYFGVIPKPAFWIGLGALVLVGGFITYRIIKNKK